MLETSSDLGAPLADARVEGTELEKEVSPPTGARSLPHAESTATSASGWGDGNAEQPYRAGLCGIIWATWVARGILKRTKALGPDQSLGVEDCYALPQGYKPEGLCETLIAAWHKEMQERGQKASVLGACWRVYRWRLVFCSAAFFIMTLVSLLDPLFVNLLIKYAGDRDASMLWGLFLSLTFLISRLTYISLENYFVFYRELMGQQIKSGLVAVIFGKTLALRQDSFQAFSSGKMNNMITTDIDQARMCLIYIDPIVNVPVKIVILGAALHSFFGIAFWIGVVYMLLQGNLNQPLMHYARKRGKEAQDNTDKRVKLVGEILQGIEVVKCYAWERAAREKVNEARQKEIKSLWRSTQLNLLMKLGFDSLIPFTMIAIFVAYGILYPEEPLTAATVFTSVTLLENFKGCLWQVPFLLTNWVLAKVSAKRIQGLLLLAETDLPVTRNLGALCAPTSMQREFSLNSSFSESLIAPAEPEIVKKDVDIEIADATFAWSKVEAEPEEQEEESRRGCCTWLRSRSVPAARDVERGNTVSSAFELKDLTMLVPSGALVVVVGATASGKTSLLQAILGEMPLTTATGKADVDRTKPIGFAPQQPWIFNATCRENILFGEPYDAKLYARTIGCCQLEEDFKLLRHGDLTRVGEKGIALSGGQKARLALARAVYRLNRCKLFLLDDPYSALDSHVAENVHKKVVCGILKGKSRVVVTNRLEFISSCDLMIVLKEGRVESMGTYNELRHSSLALQDLLRAWDESQSNQTDVQPEPSLQRTISNISNKSRNSNLQRTISNTSRNSEGSQEGEDTANDNHEEPEQEEEEARATGNLKKEVILFYVHNMGGYMVFLMLSLLYLGTEALNQVGFVWLSNWTSHPRVGNEQAFYLGVYVSLSMGGVLMGFAVSIITYVAGFRAATRLHDEMFTSVLRSPMLFFQQTPHGRIINRFSKDTSEVDRGVVGTLCGMVQQLIGTLGSLVVVGVSAFLSVIIFAPFIRVYVHIQVIFNRACTELRRLSKVFNSPVYDHFNNLCRENGLSVARSFHEVQAQIKLNGKHLERQMRCPMTMWYVENWYYQRVEPLGALLVFLVSLFIAFGHNTLVTSGSAALALSLSLRLIYQLPGCIRMYTEITIKFNCVERVLEYVTDLPSEGPEVVELRRPEPSWPSAGELEVKDLKMRYGQDKPLVLQGLSFHMAAGERIGIVGRTGAGKSSILNALFRIVEPEDGSRVFLDGVDILTIGLYDLRSRITMIPQDPVLFEESLLYNCDPFGLHSPKEVWKALVEAQLGAWLQAQAQQAQQSQAGGYETLSFAAQHQSQEVSEDLSLLEFKIHEGGQNLSAGQRQLVALARAMLRRSKFVVFDEATAALDAATDASIQHAIRQCFQGASSLTIAHRLGTIMDSDRIMVLDAGFIAELGTPSELRERSGGIFAAMVKESERKKAK